MNNCLWQPSDLARKNSLLKDFSKFINLKFENFEDIWKWSVENPEIFWSKFWDFSGIVGNKGKDTILKNKIFNKTKFFPDSKLNYAENILKKKTKQLAIGFLSESGYEEQISWKELYNQVCKFSAYLKSLDYFCYTIFIFVRKSMNFKVLSCFFDKNR